MIYIDVCHHCKASIARNIRISAMLRLSLFNVHHHATPDYPVNLGKALDWLELDTTEAI